MPVAPATLPDTILNVMGSWGEAGVGNKSFSWFQLKYFTWASYPRAPALVIYSSRAPLRAWEAKWCEATSANIAYCNLWQFFLASHAIQLLLEAHPCPILCPPPPSTHQLAMKCLAFELTVFLSLLPSLPQTLGQSWWYSESEVVPPSPWPFNFCSSCCSHWTMSTVCFPRLGRWEPFCFQFLLSDQSFLSSHSTCLHPVTSDVSHSRASFCFSFLAALPWPLSFPLLEPRLGVLPLKIHVVPYLFPFSLWIWLSITSSVITHCLTPHSIPSLPTPPGHVMVSHIWIWDFLSMLITGSVSLLASEIWTFPATAQIYSG